MSNTGIFRQKIGSKLPSNNEKQISAAALRETLEAGADSIDEIFDTFSLADGLGTYNATTGVATIKETGVTFTPVTLADKDNGKFFIVDVAGTQSITGSSKAMAIGGILVSRGTKWDYIPPADTGYEKVLAMEEFLPKMINTDDYLFAFVDLMDRLLAGFENDGAFYALKYKALSIAGSAIKNGDITLAKFATEVLNYFAKPSDLLQYEAAKDLFPLNPDPENYLWVWVDANDRLMAYQKRDGTYFFQKLLLPNSVVSWPNVSETLRALLMPHYGKKLVTLGDSITRRSNWQIILSALTGMIWSQAETQDGLSGHAAMGIGGSRIVPLLETNNPGEGGRGPGESIYTRADDVHFYNPDIIILWGGANDDINISLGSASEAAYTGGEIAIGGTPPTFAAAYKGTLMKLLTQNPSAKIIAFTRMWDDVSSTGVVTESSYTKRMAMNTMIKDICSRFSVQVIDIFQEVGITPYNTSIYLPDGIHPEEIGGDRIGRYVATKF